MKFLSLFFLFLGCGMTLGQEISKADILKTVAHMRELAQSQQAQLVQAQADFDAKSVQLQTQISLVSEWSRKAHENAKERDVLIYLFALITGFWFLSQYQSFDIPIMPPYRYLIEGAFFLIGFGAAYAFGRFTLAWAAHFIP
jgi:hypothetical protein